MDSTLERAPTPELVLQSGGIQLVGVTSVVAGESHSCALVTSGEVFCWGRNDEGQLGTGDEVTSAHAIQVVGIDGSGTLSGVTDLAAGGRSTCAVLGDGRAVCWGWTPAGNASSPTTVQAVGGGGDLTNVDRVYAGNRFACARLTGGNIACWGENTDGQLGDGDSDPLRADPEFVLNSAGDAPLAGVTALSLGESHACAATSGETLCWGSGFSGQLGSGLTGTSGSSPLPVAVVGSGGAGSLGPSIGLATGARHSCSVTASGTVCWGRGASGELGSGAFTNSTAPIATSAPVGP